jgi:hypothetical protein
MGRDALDAFGQQAMWYLVEAIILTIVFLTGLAAFWQYAIVGFVLGWFVFYSIVPVARLLGRIFPKIRKPPWQPGTPRPSSH